VLSYRASSLAVRDSASPQAWRRTCHPTCFHCIGRRFSSHGKHTGWSQGFIVMARCQPECFGLICGRVHILPYIVSKNLES